nr:Na+/H+ antiporter NhaC family protein [Pontibacillus halophilus]
MYSLRSAIMKKQGNLLAFTPLVIFLALFLGSGIVTGDFYKLPILVAALIAAVVALAMNPKEKLETKVEQFARGAGDSNIIIMVFIFILAGAFSQVANDMGAVDSTVNLALTALPQSLVIVGLFIISAFISISMGTSTGTIGALVAIGVGISQATDFSVTFVMGAIIGGSMFGDNLSVISDTTIAAVRTQQTEMADKFKANFLIVLPAALVTITILIFASIGNASPVDTESFNWVKILPYIGVLVAAVLGVNVLAVLTSGILLAAIIGFIDGSFESLTAIASSVGDGALSMASLVMLTLIIGGIVATIRENGGLDFLLNTMTKKVKSKRGGQFSIAGLIATTNLSTANNTISILTVGPLAKQISDEYGIDSRRSASILDIFACTVQGLIPYGAQMLIAAEAAGVSPVQIFPYTFYPMLIGVMGIIAIATGFPKLKPKQA